MHKLLGHKCHSDTYSSARYLVGGTHSFDPHPPILRPLESRGIRHGSVKYCLGTRNQAVGYFSSWLFCISGFGTGRNAVLGTREDQARVEFVAILPLKKMGRKPKRIKKIQSVRQKVSEIPILQVKSRSPGVPGACLRSVDR